MTYICTVGYKVSDGFQLLNEEDNIFLTEKAAGKVPDTTS